MKLEGEKRAQQPSPCERLSAYVQWIRDFNGRPAQLKCDHDCEWVEVIGGWEMMQGGEDTVRRLKLQEKHRARLRIGGMKRRVCELSTGGLSQPTLRPNIIISRTTVWVQNMRQDTQTLTIIPPT